MWVNLCDPQNMSEDPSPDTRLKNYPDPTLVTEPDSHFGFENGL